MSSGIKKASEIPMYPNLRVVARFHTPTPPLPSNGHHHRTPLALKRLCGLGEKMAYIWTGRWRTHTHTYTPTPRMLAHP